MPLFPWISSNSHSIWVFLYYKLQVENDQREEKVSKAMKKGEKKRRNRVGNLYTESLFHDSQIEDEENIDYWDDTQHDEMDVQKNIYPIRNRKRSSGDDLEETEWKTKRNNYTHFRSVDFPTDTYIPTFPGVENFLLLCLFGT